MLHAVSAADVKLIPRADFVNSNNAWDAMINADGTKFVYEAPSGDRKAIWLGTPEQPSKATPLFLDSKFSFQYFKWSMNPDYLIVFADNQGDERWRLFSINIKSGKQQPLSPGDGERATLIGLNRENKDEVVIAQNTRDKHYNDLYRVSLKTGNKTLMFTNTAQYTHFYLDANAELKLLQRRQETDESFIIEKPLKDSSGEPETLLRIDFSDTRAFRFIGFSSDNQWFYILDSTGRDKAALVKVNYQTGKRTLVAKNERADIKEVLFDPRTSKPIAYAVDYLNRTWHSLLSKDDHLFERLNNEFDGRVDIISISADGTQLTAYVSGRNPSYYMMINRTSGKTSKIIDAYPALVKHKFSPKVAFEMKTRDGQTQTGTFVAAHGSDKDGDGFPDYPTPLILMAHGGPWDQARPGFDTWQQWLANRGYSVISPNFRGSTGLGKDWLNQGNQQWGGIIHQDVIDSIDWAIKMGYANKNKIGSIGASFGGYVTLRTLTATPDKLACGVSTSASPNLISLYESLPEYWQAFKKEYLFRVGDATSEEGKALLKSHSPLFSANKIAKPLLIFHALNDSRVNIEEPRQIISAMNNNNSPVSFGVFKKSGHVMQNENTTLLYQAIVEQFFAHCLGGNVEPFQTPIDGQQFEFEQGGDFFSTD